MNHEASTHWVTRSSVGGDEPSHPSPPLSYVMVVDGASVEAVEGAEVAARSASAAAVAVDVRLD